MIATIAVLTVAVSSGGLVAPASGQTRTADYCLPVSALAPLLPARLLDGMGQVDFPISTSSADAQRFFNQGMVQLYAFWFVEAERSFLQAASLDPDSAMVHWGVAMAAPGDFRPAYQHYLDPNRALPLIPAPGSPESRTRDAILRATAPGARRSAREQLYIDAVRARHNPRSRRPDDDYIGLLRKIVDSYPDDLHAKAILALALTTGHDPVTRQARPGNGEAVRLLKAVLAADPDHPGAHHFLIHAVEGGSLMDEAAVALNRYPALSPGIPHAVHMPGHVFSQTGRFDDAIAAFEATSRIERAYMDRDATYGIEHFLHNEAFLIYVLGAAGRDDDALERASSLMKIPENPRQRQEPQPLSAYRQGWLSTLRTLVRARRWESVLDPGKLPLYDKPIETVWYHWARGLAQVMSGDVPAAQNSSRLLQVTMDNLRRVINPIPQALFVARAELDAIIQIKSGNAGGWDALEKASTSERELLYTEPPVYPRPVDESIGWIALVSEDWKRGEAAFRRALQREPGAARAVEGLAEISRRNPRER